MRMLTYNVLGRLGDWPTRRTVMRPALRELAPDLAVLQETVVDDGYDQVVDLLGDDYHVEHQIGRTDDGVGASIASRWPIRVARAEPLHVTPRVERAEPWIGSVVLARVDAPDPYGDVLVVHFKPSWQFHLAHERELQAVAVAGMIEDEIAADPPRHVILAGDFDSTPDSSTTPSTESGPATTSASPPNSAAGDEVVVRLTVVQMAPASTAGCNAGGTPQRRDRQRRVVRT